MFYLAGAVIASLCMTFLMKYSEAHGGNRYALNIWNYFTGTLFSFFLLENKSNLWVNDGGITLGIGALNGFLFVLCLVLIQISIVKNGAPLTTTFNKLGVLIPTIFSAIAFAEIPSVLQTFGLALAIFAIIYMNREKGESRPSFMAGLFFIFGLGGLIEVLSKLYSRYYDSESQTLFIMYTFFFALLVSVIFFFKNNRTMTLQDIIIGICVGVPNQLSSLLVIRAATTLPAYIVYPTYSAGAILLVNIINYLVFKETLTKRQYVATALIGLALIFLNLS